MPIYEYQCTACGHHFDTIQTFKEEALTHCPVCGESTLKKLISAPAFHLKGTGWYVTDFKDPVKPAAGSQENKEVSAGEKKTEENTVKKESVTGAKDTKSAAKKSDKAD